MWVKPHIYNKMLQPKYSAPDCKELRLSGTGVLCASEPFPMSGNTNEGYTDSGNYFYFD